MAQQQALAAPMENCWNKPISSTHPTERAIPVEVGGASAPIQLPLNEGLPSSGRRKSPNQARRSQLQDVNSPFWPHGSAATAANYAAGGLLPTRAPLTLQHLRT